MSFKPRPMKTVPAMWSRIAPAFGFRLSHWPMAPEK